MTEHYPKHTKKVLVYCNTCNKLTMHRVDNGRRGPCQEHETEGLSRKQEKARTDRAENEKQPGLFQSQVSGPGSQVV